MLKSPLTYVLKRNKQKVIYEQYIYSYLNCVLNTAQQAALGGTVIGSMDNTFLHLELEMSIR